MNGALGRAAWTLLVCGTALGQDTTTTTPGAGGVPANQVQPGTQPATPGITELPPPPGEGDIELSVFSEPVDIKAFVEYVADALQIIIVGNDQLAGTVVFNAPVKVKREGLLPLLDSLLDQHGFTIVRDPAGFYVIQPNTSVKIGPGGEQSTTKLIATPGIRPSALREMITGQLGQGDGAAQRVAFLDDLGVIVVTDAPRRIAALQSLVGELAERLANQQLMRFEVNHLAASVARERIIKLVGGGSGGASPMNPQQQGQPEQPAMPGDPTRLANLPDRLTVDPQGNALIFRGESTEADLVERVLAVIDVPNVLETRQYFAGRAASSIADVARARGLGEIQTIQTRASSMQPGMSDFGFQFGGGINPATGMPMPQASSGASMVVDPSRGLIVFSGTAAQHEQMEALLREFNTEEEQIVVRAYKLNDADSEEVADLITGLLENRAKSTETGSLLPGQGSMMENMRNLNAFGFIPPQPEGAEGEGVNFAAGQDVFVLADKANNQVLVKAPAKLQKQFEDLISRLDLRRPQVYIEAKIVSVTANEDFRLAFEYQLINAGGAGGAFNFNSGLGTFGEDGTFLDPKQVNTGLPALTAAIINSDYVPIIINALQRDVNARVLATPQLLVDDNEPAQVASVEVQQSRVVQVNTGSPNTETAGAPQEAGTTLEVTPHISRGGYVRLEYKIEQSRFLGPSLDGIPADQLRNSISGDSVTVPQDTTVVVGGLRLSSSGDTIVKIPLLGDIPLIGHLFRDTNKNDRSTILYVFLTPRILQEPTIQDLTLLTRGPQAEVNEVQMIPMLEPLLIEVVPKGFPLPAGAGTEEMGSGSR